MAWRLLSDKCANFFKNIWETLHSREFISRYRTSPTAFIRNRKFPFHNLVLFLLGNLKSSYNKELDRFFHQINGGIISQSDITKPTVTTARKNLDPEVFLELNRQYVLHAEQNLPLTTWNGFRILALDGSTLRLPNCPSIRDHFGQRSGGQGVACPMGRISQLYDPINKLTIESILTPIDIGEREHAHQLLLNLMPNDLVILDRGYPAFTLFKTISYTNADFCARMTTKWAIVKQFLKSGLKDQIVYFNPTRANSKECADLGFDNDPIMIRLLRIELSSGETEVLSTTLTDQDVYNYNLFADLYHQRWFVEVDYQFLKLPLEIENFTGKTVHSVYQDCYAQIFAKNITSILSFEARREIKRSGKKQIYEHQVNFTYALSKTKEVMTRLFYECSSNIKSLMNILEQLFLKITEPVRPGRKFHRNQRVYKRVYHYNRKCIA